MEIYEEALCHYTLTGLLILWVNGWFKTIGLLLVAVAASVLMLYFDEHWDEVTLNEDKVNRLRDAQGDSEGGTYQAVSDEAESQSDDGSETNVRV